jgi:hypothetical protein
MMVSKLSSLHTNVKWNAMNQKCLYLEREKGKQKWMEKKQDKIQKVLAYCF